MFVLIGGFLLLMLIGLPVAMSMAAASLAYILIYNVAPDLIAAQRMIAGVESFPLLAVPFFIFMGTVLEKSKLAEDLLQEIGQQRHHARPHQHQHQRNCRQLGHEGERLFVH